MRKPLEILVAEHDRDVAEGLCDILELAGHKVHRAFTPEKTRELLRLHDFHVAFVNIKNEGCSKLESFAEIRKIKPDAKLVMMSAHTIDQLTAEVTDGGMVKVVSAPVDMDGLADALSAVGPAGTLLIEDVPTDFGATLEAAFKEFDTHAAIARDRDEALASIAEGGSDLLLLDLRLSAVRCLEVYLEVRRQGWSQPVIIFQSYADDVPVRNDILHNDLLLKPFDPAYMVKLLESMADTLDDGWVSPDPAATAAPDADDQNGDTAAQGSDEAASPVHGDGSTSPDLAAPAAPDLVEQSSDSGTEDAAEVADSEPGDVLLWDEPEPSRAPFAEPSVSLDEAEPVPPPASEPEAIPEPDLVAEAPPPFAEAPAPAERPEDDPSEAEESNLPDEDDPAESRLPAGVGFSVEQLEQAVTLAEDPGPGSSDAPPAGADEAPEPEPGAEAYRVLVVDDDVDMAEGLAEILDDTGLIVRVAHSSETALATLREFEANIALVDIQLGRNNGLDLVPILKGLCPELIVMMVTAQTEQQTAIEALRMGAFDYLNKPLHPEELLAAMDRCFYSLAKSASLAALPAAAADPKAAGAEYIAKLSHKLGAEHNPVVGYSEVLSEEMLGSPVPAHDATEAGDATDADSLLEAVVRDFTDIARGESGKVEALDQEVDLTRVIFKCLKLVQPAASAAGVTVEIELAQIPVFIIGDRSKLTQILLGLLVNAIEFTPPQGKIRFVLERDDDAAVVARVEDTGPGMAEETKSQALGPAIDSDGAIVPGYQGSGLSLPVAASFAALHGGTLSLDSEAGAGTTASLRLPAERNIALKRAVAV